MKKHKTTLKQQLQEKEMKLLERISGFETKWLLKGFAQLLEVRDSSSVSILHLSISILQSLLDRFAFSLLVLLIFVALSDSLCLSVFIDLFRCSAVAFWLTRTSLPTTCLAKRCRSRLALTP